MSKKTAPTFFYSLQTCWDIIFSAPDQSQGKKNGFQLNVPLLTQIFPKCIVEQISQGLNKMMDSIFGNLKVEIEHPKQLEDRMLPILQDVGSE